MVTDKSTEEIYQMVDEVYFNGELANAGQVEPQMAEDAQNVFVQVTSWFDEHELPFNTETMEKYKDQILQGLPPEVQEVFNDEPGKILNNEELTNELKSLKKVGFWAFLILVLILIIK